MALNVNVERPVGVHEGDRTRCVHPCRALIVAGNNVAIESIQQTVCALHVQCRHCCQVEEQFKYVRLNMSDLQLNVRTSS